MWHRYLRPIGKYKTKDDNRGLGLLREGLEGSDGDEILRTKDVNVEGGGKKVGGEASYVEGKSEVHTFMGGGQAMSNKEPYGNTVSKIIQYCCNML